MVLNPNTSGDVLPAEMNTTPLIDVMLVLLTLLIITIPIQTHAVKIDLGQGAPAVAPPAITVQVAFDGVISWDGAAVDRATLDADLSRAAAQRPQPEIRISADRLARYDTVAKVMADAQRLGVSRIGVIGADDR